MNDLDSGAPYDKVLDVRYHIQDQGCYCGAAVAMMILRSLGQPLRPQQELFKKIYNSDPVWGGKIPGSSPKGLAAALEYFAPPSRNLRVTPTYYAHQEDVIKRLVELLYAPDAVAPAVLISECGHWLAVTGFQTDVEPVAGVDFHVLGFYINNPWYLAANFNHADNDPCGAGKFGVQNEFASVPAMLDVLTACPKVPRPFAVVEATPGKAIGTMLLQKPATYRTAARREDESLWTDASFDASAVRNLALDGVRMHGLDASGFFPGTGRIRAGDPALVQRLDLLDSYYALVPLFRGRNRTGFARIDMNDGSLLGACVSDADLTALRGAEDAVLAARWECAETFARPRPGTFVAHPTLVWRPCRESTSPYAPFRQISIAGRIAYYGSDGMLRLSLTPLRG